MTAGTAAATSVGMTKRILLSLLTFTAACAVDEPAASTEDVADDEQLSIDIPSCGAGAPSVSFTNFFTSTSSNGPFYNVCGGNYVIDVVNLDHAHLTTTAKLTIASFGSTIFPGQDAETACNGTQLEYMLYRGEGGERFLSVGSNSTVVNAHYNKHLGFGDPTCDFTFTTYSIGNAHVSPFRSGDTLRLVVKASQRTDAKGARPPEHRAALGVKVDWTL